MWKILGITLSGALLGAILLAETAGAQQMPTQGAQMQHQPPMAGHSAAPTLPGQDAFGAIQEVVRILESDPTTDWSKVNLEGLRQHLIDVNDVTLRSEVKSAVAPGRLGFIGLLAEGFHHQPHHLATARGEDLEGHGH